jgi:hypothetical protein
MQSEAKSAKRSFVSKMKILDILICYAKQFVAKLKPRSEASRQNISKFNFRRETSCIFASHGHFKQNSTQQKNGDVTLKG